MSPKQEIPTAGREAGKMRPVMVRDRHGSEGRYSHRKAVLEVEHLRRELGLSQKEVALGIGVSEPEYSQKKRGIINSFSLDEFGRLADFFERKTGRPLIGFPFLDRMLQDAVDRQAGGWTPPR